METQESKTIRKWEVTAGPRQRKAALDALGKLLQTAKEHVEITGTIGGDEHRYVLYSPFSAPSGRAVAAMPCSDFGYLNLDPDRYPGRGRTDDDEDEPRTLGPNHKDGCDGTPWRYSGEGYNRVRLCTCGAEDHAPEGTAEGDELAEKGGAS